MARHRFPKRPQSGRPARSTGGAPRGDTVARPDEAGPERLQKLLAHAGVGSRRACEELILQGRVSVGGRVVRELGTKTTPSAAIEVDGQRIRLERPVYLAVHKPKGYVSTTNDPAGRPRVVDLVAEVAERVYTVGRLDEESTGLMLLTNDGELANRLAHPKFGVEKVYRALVAGQPERETLDALVEGIWLSDGKARARRVRVIGEQGGATMVEMVLAEGKNREVRRMWAKRGHKVMRLTRVAIGPVTLQGLKPGQWRHLDAFEVNQLRRLARGELVATGSIGRPAKYPSKPRRGAARHQRVAAGSDSAERSEAMPFVPKIAGADRLPPPSQRRKLDMARPRPARPARPVQTRPTPVTGPRRIVLGAEPAADAAPKRPAERRTRTLPKRPRPPRKPRSDK